MSPLNTCLFNAKTDAALYYIYFELDGLHKGGNWMFQRGRTSFHHCHHCLAGMELIVFVIAAMGLCLDM